MLEQKGSTAQSYLAQAGSDQDALGAKVAGQLLTQPKADASSQQTPISTDTERVFINAEEVADAAGDKYIGINHIMLGMMKIEDFLSAIE